MDRSELIALFDQDQRIDITYPTMRREVVPNLVRHTDTFPGGEGTILYSHLDETNVEQVIREQVDYFKGLGQDLEWKVYDYDQPPDLKDRLAAQGFNVEEVEAVMLLDLQSAPEVLWQPVPENVRRITYPGQLSDVQSVEQQTWNEDFSWIGRYLGDALRNIPDQMSVYVAYVDQQPASTAWVYFPEHSQFASLWGGSTIRDYRKQGLYTALLSARAQEARQRQVRYLCVDASDMSRPILEKFGFERIAYTYPCHWKLKS